MLPTEPNLKRLRGTVLRGLAIVALSSLLHIGMTVLAMVKGWGLEPVSWHWIIGAGFFGVLFSKMVLLLDKEDE